MEAAASFAAAYHDFLKTKGTRPREGHSSLVVVLLWCMGALTVLYFLVLSRLPTLALALRLAARTPEFLQRASLSFEWALY